MEFRCEDLPEQGLTLVQPSSPEFGSLLADIQSRLDDKVDGAPPIPEQFRPHINEQDRPTSAVLLNRSTKSVAALQAVWDFQDVKGNSYQHSIGMLSTQVLLPFGMREDFLKRTWYWNTILPGSKRYVSQSGLFGDNTDVRPPAPSEKMSGGGVGGGGGGRRGVSGGLPPQQITLILDGVFFLDGEFAGPNREKLFEQTTANAEAHMLVARIAREGHDKGLDPAQIIANITKVTGPDPQDARSSIPPSVRNPGATLQDFLEWALKRLARQFSRERRLPQYSDEQAVYRIMSWTETVLPNFRRI
jgi:hypothetical protein